MDFDKIRIVLKIELDDLRPLPPAAVRNLEEFTEWSGLIILMLGL